MSASVVDGLRTEIDKLKAKRAALLEQVRQIDEACAALGVQIAPDEGKSRTRAVNGQTQAEAVLAWITEAGSKGLTSSEAQKRWTEAGYPLFAAVVVSKLRKEGKIRAEKLPKGERGYRYYPR